MSNGDDLSGRFLRRRCLLRDGDMVAKKYNDKKQHDSAEHANLAKLMPGGAVQRNVRATVSLMATDRDENASTLRASTHFTARWMSAPSHQRRIRDVRAMSAHPPTPEASLHCRER
jgi:hypothetical protein